VMLLRQALGDSVEQPRYIERVRGQGYRLIPEAKIEAVAETGIPDQAAVPALRLSPIMTNRAAAQRRAASAWVLTAAAVLLAAVASWLALDKTRDSAARARAIAVLPFENRSVTEEDAGFFAQGIHDDLITRLAAIKDLKVTPRASVMELRAQPLTPRAVAEELGVRVVLDGSVQRAGNKVRVNVHLIDAWTNETIWGETYDEELTAENVFAIQEGIVTAIAKELEAKLTPEEATQLAQTPTQNMRALDLYMSGRDYERPPFAYWGMAALQYQRAVEEDPQFALAHARLSLASLLAYYNIDWDRARVEVAKKAAEEAVRLKPDLAIGRVAMAFFLIAEKRDLQGAQHELAAAEPYAHDEPQFFIVRALVHESLGRHDAAAADRAAALALNPRDPALMLDVAMWHARVREHDEAMRLVDRALDIRPDFTGAALFKAELALLRDGDTTLIKDLPTALFNDDLGRRIRLEELKWLAALYERDYVGAARILEESVSSESGDDDEARKSAQRRSESVPFLLSKATTLRLAGDFDAARKLYEKGLAQIPDDNDQWAMWRAAFLASCGRSEEAIGIATRFLSQSDSEGPIANAMRLWLAVEVFAPAGANALTVQMLDEYLSRPGSWAVEGLARHPRLEFLRHDPTFKALIAKYRRT